MTVENILRCWGMYCQLVINHVGCCTKPDDRILYQLVLMHSDVYKNSIPESMKWTLTGWSGTGVLEANGLKLMVDLSIPTDCTLTKHRPDLIAFVSESRRIVIFEVACVRDPLVLEQEEEKKNKYQELPADKHGRSESWLEGVGSPSGYWSAG